MQGSLTHILHKKGDPVENQSKKSNSRYCRAKFWMLPLEGCKRRMQCNVEFRYQLSICLGPRKITENLDIVGRLQGLPDANWLIASSPTLNTRALTLVPICAVFLFPFLFLFFQIFLQLFLSAYSLDRHQTAYNTCGRNERMYEQICIYLCLWFLDYQKIWESIVLVVWKNRIVYEACCSSSNKDYVSQLRSDWPVKL
jgi:hypothetical protein